jgi:hypothetical protein
MLIKGSNKTTYVIVFLQSIDMNHWLKNGTKLGKRIFSIQALCLLCQLQAHKTKAEKKDRYFTVAFSDTNINGIIWYNFQLIDKKT